jgi:chemotaxis methyl-accepting protein methylase
LPACLRRIRAQTLSEARRKLMQDPSLIGPALGTITIGVTSFFRDAAVFETLAREVIPSLGRENGHARVWSAGSSSGEELYSVAMLLAEAGLLGRATLLGTDCSAPAIAQAREGCYEVPALRDVPQGWREKYFVLRHCRWQVCGELRRGAQWRKADLTQIVEPGLWDLIICRNVAIYFTPAVAARVYQSLAGALRPGGVLVVGKAEQPMAATQLRPLASCIYRR